MKRFLAAITILGYVMGCYAQQLGIADYCDLSIATPAAPKEITPLNDGVSFAVMNDKGTAIETYSYKTGKKTGEIFNVSEIKGDLKIDDFEGFNISSNGKKILLWRERKKIYRNSFTAEFYVFDTFRSTIARVSEKGPQRCATISHDGRYVAYVRDNNIFISNLDYKTDNQITNDGEINKIIYGAPDWSYEEEFDVKSTICWNNDDTVLAFMRFDESEVNLYSFDDYKGYCDAGFATTLYPVTFSYKYPLPGTPVSQVSVIAYNLDNKTTKIMDIPKGERDYIPGVKFDGEGKNLMVSVVNHDQNQLHVFSVNPGSTVSKLILNENSNTWISPVIYQKIAYEKTGIVKIGESNGYKHLFLYDYSGNLRKQLTKGDFNVTDYYGSDRLGNYYFQSTIKGAINRNICVVDSKGVVKTLGNEEGTANAWFSSTNDYYLKSYSSSQIPPQYTLHDSKGTKLAVIENNEVYANKYKNAPKMEFLKVQNALGEEMNAYMIKPQDFDPSKKYPLLMYQYNGPESQEVLNRWRMEGIFYLASCGYIIGCVDGRGTANRTESWTKCVYKELGVKESEDQLAGAKYFSSLPYIDPSRTGCFGWSYGGYMTLMEVGSKDCKFKCGIAMAPVSNWRYYDSIYTERYMQSPGQNPNGYEKSAPINRIPDLNSRLLIMSGTNDDNVHFYNTLVYAGEASGEGKVIDMMVYPGFEHSLRMCDARVQLFRKIENYLNLNLK